MERITEEQCTGNKATGLALFQELFKGRDLSTLAADTNLAKGQMLPV